MRLLAIPYPVIDPVALQLGPLAVKWYGLAYMAGLLLGWLYIKRLLDQDQLWAGGKPPLEPQRVDDLLHVHDGRRAARRAARLRPVLRAAVLSHQSPGNSGRVERRHGVPRRAPRLHRGHLVFARRVSADPWSVLDLCAAATPMGLFFGRLANFINAELVAGRARCPGRWCFPAPDLVERHPSQLYEAFFEGLVLFAVLWWLTHTLLALRRPGLVAGAFMLGYGLARSFCEFFREPDPGHVLTLGPFTAGILYSLPMIVVGIWLMRDAARRTPAAADAQRSG